MRGLNQLQRLSETFAYFIPTPDRFYSVAGSTLTATAMGWGCGLVGKVIYPKTEISPWRCAAWFALAYQIKQFFNLLGFQADCCLGLTHYLNHREERLKEEFTVRNHICEYYWRVIQLRNRSLNVIDRLFSSIFHIRTYQLVIESSIEIEEASFLEMSRYHIWSVVKSAILDHLSLASASRLSCHLGFPLASHISLSLILIIQAIVIDIFFVPALYISIRFCDHLVEKWGEKNPISVAYRAVCIQRFLPSL